MSDIIQKIDIHAHATAFPQYAAVNPLNNQPMVSAEDVLGFYDKLHIEKGVLMTLLSPEAQYMTLSSENNKFLVDKYPDRFLWFCGVDPRSCENTADSDLGYLLHHYKSLGAKGLGELTANLYTDDPKMDNLFTCCEKEKMPVTIHIAPHKDGCYGIVDEIGLPRLEKMLKKHPDLIILGHSQPFWSEIGENSEEIRGTYPKGKIKEGRIAKLLREYGNLYCDLSAGSAANAMMRDPDYTVRFIEEFSDRLCYGCDICGAKATFPYDFDNFLTDLREKGGISEENYRKLVRDNAVKLLGL